MKVNWILALAAAMAAICGVPAVSAQSPADSFSDGIQADLASFGGATGGCDASCKGCDSCADACEPWRLFPEIGCGWSLTGWVALGATANADHPRSRINGPVTFNDRANFQANQMYLTFGRDADTSECGVAWGGRVDLLFGTDYIFTQAAGWETHDDFATHWNRAGNQYGLAMPQFYGELGIYDLTIKLGHFYTIIGNEVVTAPGNFFYSHAYTMQYGEPFTHMGGLASWSLGDRLVLHGGLVNGWDKVDAQTDVASFIGGVNYTPCHERYSLAFSFITGDEDGVAGMTDHTRTMYSIVFNLQISENLEYVLQHDNGWNDYDGARGDEEWYGINQYLFYTINDCWKLGARLEWFRDDDGSRLIFAPIRAGGLGVFGLNPGVNPPQSDFAGDYYNISLGVNWTPTTNLTFRPEIRWDWSEDTGIRPFDDLTKDSQFLGAFDVIWLF